jgi:hypothetical protein
MKEDLYHAGKVMSRALSVGFLVGVSAEIVRAIPIGPEAHLADSWTGWFYAGMASVPTPLPFVGISSSLYGSSAWVGASAGIGVGPSGGAYAALYYEFIPDAYYSFKDNRCTCNALRFASVTDPEKLVRIMKAIFSE